MEEEDRISSLPDCLIVEILSRLESTKEAIRTSVLSKQWIHLWTLVPNLIFDFTMFPKSDDLHSYVDQIITECGDKLKNLNKFQISVSYSPLFESSVNNWIQYVINRNVQEFDLLIPFNLYSSCDDDFVLPQSIFNNSCFTILGLAGCIFSPAGSVAWKNLKTLSISFVELNEDLIQYILSGSPVLETFELFYCYGFTRLDITSKSVKNLVFSEDRLIMPLNALSVIEINAPYTLSLALGAPYTLSLTLNVPSLIKAEINFWKTGSRVKSWQEMPGDFIQNLRHVKELKIWGNVFTGSRSFKS